jgi:hypothetical protein
MRSNVKWKPTGEHQAFSIKEDVAFPFLTMSDELAGTTRKFYKSSSLEGVPVIAQISIEQRDGSFKHVITSKGVMIKEEDGMYVVPFEFLEPISEDSDESLIEEVKEKIEDVSEKVKVFIPKDEKVEKVLGFSYKQLFVITGVAFATYLIAK